MELSRADKLKLLDLLQKELAGEEEKKEFISVYFTNPTSRDFTHSYNSKPYTIKAGQTILLPGDLAEHLAKHLINRELAGKYADIIKHPKAGVANIDIRLHPERAEMLSRILSSPVASADSEIDLAIKTANLKKEIEAKQQEVIEEAEEEAEEAEEAEEIVDEVVAEVAPKKVAKKAAKKAVKKVAKKAVVEEVETFDEATS